MSAIPRSYDTLVRALRWSSPLLGRGSSKLAAGIRGRVGARAELERWAGMYRDPSRCLVWTHAPSVGEGLQARAILEALRDVRPDLQTAYTFFSPSAEKLAAGLPADVAAYFPWDVRTEMDQLVERLHPDLIAFTKTEVWPAVTAAAVERGVPVVLTAATLPPGAGRLRAPAKHFLRRTFGALTRVLAISTEDGERFLELDVPEDRIDVTGDPGIDSAWRRARAADPGAPYLAPFLDDARAILVAGSTWEPDEGVLVPALARVRERFPDLRVIIAPHEPSEDRLVALDAKLRASGFRTERLAEVEQRGNAEGSDAVIVDRVGVLAHIYTVGAMAYVGGGFGRDGLHSVLEPASAAIPVLFGPRHANARAAGELEAAGGARSVSGGRELGAAVETWIEDAARRKEAGTRASAYIEAHRGAARRTAEALADHFSSPDGAKR